MNDRVHRDLVLNAAVGVIASAVVLLCVFTFTILSIPAFVAAILGTIGAEFIVPLPVFLWLYVGVHRAFASEVEYFRKVTSRE